MRLIKMTGGLGNQMFIYSFYLRMKSLFPDTTYLDLSDMNHYKVHNGYEMHRVFNLPKVEISMPQKLKKVIEFFIFRTLLERKYTLEDLFKKRNYPLLYFKGFYQNEEYFKPIKEEILNTFVFDERLNNKKTNDLLAVLNKDNRSVSLHIRRGDYLEPKYYKSMGGICTLNYFANAIDYIRKKIGEVNFYVFSDDIDYAKEHLNLSDATFIDWNKGKESYQDMLLMSHCKHHIISNSTFSWWGAYLGKYTNKIVLSPARWTWNNEDISILPPSWIRIPIE